MFHSAQHHDLKENKADQSMSEQSSARSVEWRGLSWSTCVMVCCAAEICVSWGRQLLPALPDFGPERPNSRLDDTNFPPSSLSTLPTIGSDHGDAPADSTSSCPAQLQLVFQQPSRVLLAAPGAQVIVQIPSDSRGAKRAQGGRRAAAGGGESPP